MHKTIITLPNDFTDYVYIDIYHRTPEFRVLICIKKKLGKKWKYVGIHLGLDDDVITTIEINNNDVEDQTFKMFQEWLHKDVSSCYCKLISALKEENLDSAAEILKSKIKLS